MSDETHEHCWHQTGASTTMGFAGGTDGHRCCHCGKVIHVQWRTVEETLAGHGPHFTHTTKVYEWPEDSHE